MVDQRLDPHQRNVFIFGLDDFHRAQLCRIRGAERYAFHALLQVEDLFNRPSYVMDDLIDRSMGELRQFGRAVDGVTGYWDFPTSDLIPIVAAELGLPGPSLEAVLKCEHKYWSRLEQRAVAPEMVPEFELVDPFDPDAPAKIGLRYPFWLKPVKSHSSFLGFRVGDRAELDRALRRLRKENIAAEPFGRLMGRVDAPTDVRRAGGSACIAEEIIGGHQCTAEGYALGGEVTVYGVIDSIRGPNRSSFQRYQYPSRLPRMVQRRIAEASERIIRHIGLDQSAFNIEYFYDRRSDRIRLLEINPRISQSHSELFSLVDGAPNSQVSVKLAAGEQPEMPYREGPCGVAAKFMVRSYQDGIVARTPAPEDIARVEECFPGTRVSLDVCPGMRLSQLPWQDSYSYEIAQIHTGAARAQELPGQYEAILEMLDLRLQLVA